MNTLLKEYLRVLAIKTRDEQKLTQEKMSAKMAMSENSYSAIETGISMCGTLTAVLLLAEQEDPKACLDEIKAKFKELEEDAKKQNHDNMQ